MEITNNIYYTLVFPATSPQLKLKIIQRSQCHIIEIGLAVEVWQ